MGVFWGDGGHLGISMVTFGVTERSWGGHHWYLGIGVFWGHRGEVWGWQSDIWGLHGSILGSAW